MPGIDYKNDLSDPKSPLLVICGPCVIEGEQAALQAAESLKKIFDKHPCLWVYKSSYDKANRTSIEAYRGPGLQQGLHILKKVKQLFEVPLLTDVHNPQEAQAAAEYVDILQIPAFLSRQTDLVVACGNTQRIVNIKKGQFMAPWDIQHSIGKIASTGNHQILLTDRGSSFGYNNLVADMRAIPVMQAMGYPVCFDATHSIQLPGGEGKHSGGQKEFALPLAKAAIAAGANALFLEAHPHPSKAKSDAKTMLAFDELDHFLHQVCTLYSTCQQLSLCPAIKS